MDEDSSTKFIGSLTKFLQSLCNGYVEFQKGVELVGHIYLSIDTGEKVDYILHEKVNKNDENSVTFVSNSFHAQPQNKDKTKETPSKSDAKGSNERLHDDDDDDDIMIVDHSQGVIGSTNSGSVLPRGMKRMASPGSDHRHGQRARTSAGSSSTQNQNASGHSFTSINRQHSGRPSATVTSQGASQSENLNISEVKLEQISRDELLTLASQVGEGTAGPPHSSSSGSRSHSQPQHSGMASGSGRGDAALWVKQEVTDDGGGGNDSGWSQERDDSNSNSGSNLYPVMLHQNPAAFPSSSIPGFSGPGGSGNQSAGNPFPMPGTSQDLSGLDPSEKMGWTRRCRTSFTQTQIRTLEKEFDQGQYLTRPRRCYLAKKLNLTERHITIWFQNRRQKLKKEQQQGAGEKDFCRPSQLPNQSLWYPGLGNKDLGSYHQAHHAQFQLPLSPGVQDLSRHNQSPYHSQLSQSPGSKEASIFGQSPNQFQMPQSPSVQDLSRRNQSPYHSQLSQSPGTRDMRRYSHSPSQSQPSPNPGAKDLSMHGQSPSQSLMSQSPDIKDVVSSYQPPSNQSQQSPGSGGKDLGSYNQSPSQSLQSPSSYNKELGSCSQSSNHSLPSQSPSGKDLPCSYDQSPSQSQLSGSPGTTKDLGSAILSPKRSLSPGGRGDSSQGESPSQAVLPESHGNMD
ncbi:uncharacterized protein LOC143293570 [Babylonia areolata]|uniref:uncharacterized protein LOC143293570 n=1 Tax=Babylonia areolata TaxID=304850 RepID=UPI003FCF5EF3